MCAATINIFIPTYLFTAAARGHRSGLLFGYHKVLPTGNVVNFNITALLPYDDVQLDQLVCHKHCHFTDYDEDQCECTERLKIRFLGELRDDSDDSELQLIQQESEKRASYHQQLQNLRRCYRRFQLVFSFDSAYAPHMSSHESSGDSIDSSLDYLLEDRRTYSSIQLTSISCFDQPLHNYAHVTLIYYDTRNFMSSQLLNRFNVEDNRVEFVEFINESLKNTAQLFIEQHPKNVVKSWSLKSLCPRPFANNKTKQQPTSSTTSNHSSQSSSSSHHKQSNHKSTTSHQEATTDLAISAVLFSRLILLMPRRLIRAFVYFTSQQRSSLTWKANWSAGGKILEKVLSTFSTIYDLPLLHKSTTVTQLKFRFLQLTICWKLMREIPRRRISLSLGNVLSSVVIDTLLGVITIVALHYYSTPAYWLKQAWNYADSMVEDVDRLLRVLQSMPAGLKLNRPLNMALSQFYLYHIYLWESYMDIIRPIFGVVMQAIFYCGLFGFTCILSLLSDIFSLVTIHIFCFYGYGCQLYGLQISGIGALWRLFRGKKYNQLRNRVDSYSYDNEQLFIGTILFTVLLFLLPTVFMYYLVFLVLRFLTLAVQEGLFFFIEHISSMPLYTLFLWLFNSRTISSRVVFEVITNTENDVDQLQQQNLNNPGLQDALANHIANHIGNNHHNNDHNPDIDSNTPLVIRLRTERVSLFKIISSRYDDMLQSLHAYRQTSSAKQLTWNEFFQSILTGKLLHQNLSIGLSLLLFIGYVLVMVYYTYHSVSS